MANNRIWLVHKGAGLGVMLGKRMGMGYYQPPEAQRLQEFYDYLESKGWGEIDLDDFVLAIDEECNPYQFIDWDYSREEVDGFAKIKILPEGTMMARRREQDERIRDGAA